VDEFELLFELKKPAKQVVQQPTGMTKSTAQIRHSITRKVLECSNLNRKAIPSPQFREDKQGLHLCYTSEQRNGKRIERPGVLAGRSVAPDLVGLHRLCKENQESV